MAVIDRKGKIFGLINIIDLIIVVLIIVAAVGGVYKFSNLRQATYEDTETLDLVIKVEGESQGLVEAIKSGDVLLDSVRGTEFGKVIDKDVKPHKELVISKDGKVEFKEIPETYDISIKLESSAIVNNDGILIGTKPTYIGSEIRVKSKIYVFDAKVTNIQK